MTGAFILEESKENKTTLSLKIICEQKPIIPLEWQGKLIPFGTLDSNFLNLIKSFNSNNQNQEKIIIFCNNVTKFVDFI